MQTLSDILETTAFEKVAGGFVGTTGQGAGMVYSFNSSTFSGNNITAVGQTVTGVAVFKR